MERSADCFLSVVVPLRNEAALLGSFVPRLHAVVSAAYENFEIVLVDDGSTDETPQHMDELLVALDGMRYVRLSRAFGTEVAITAGLETAIGDYIAVLLPCDPVEDVPEMVGLARRDACMVVGRTTGARGPFFQRLARRLFYGVCRRLLGVNVPENTTCFFVASRQVVNSVNQIKDKFRYLKALATYTGFRIHFHDYEPVDGGVRLYRVGFWELLNRAIDFVVTSTTRPLRLVSLLGLFVSGINLLYIGYIALVALLKSHVAEGWVTMSTQNAIAFFVLNMVLATVCEYLGRVLVETQERPIYFVLEEKTSSVAIPNQERRNVVTTSSTI